MGFGRLREGEKKVQESILRGRPLPVQIELLVGVLANRREHEEAGS
jgi:hypothetical protein